MVARTLLSALLLPVMLLVAPLPALAQGGPHHAGLVVRYADGKVDTACVAFDEATITGEQLLERSPFRPIVNPNGGFGGAVCSINNQGCRFPAEDCFCRCMGTQCEYWAYYLAQGSGSATSWQYSQTGASGVQVRDGDLQGWSWGQGNFSSGTEPPKIAYADVCKAGAGSNRAAAGGAGGGAAPGIGAAALAQYAGYALIVVLLAGLGALVVTRRRPRGG
jgi:hypothetical protein